MKLSSSNHLNGGLSFIVAMSMLVGLPQEVLAKRKKHIESLPHVLSSKPWPPAIAPEFIRAVKRDKLLIANNFGRLSIVDFKNAGRKEGVEPTVLAEITGVGKKIISVSSDKSSTYALLKDSSDRTQSPKVKLVEINVHKLKEPHVVSTSLIKELNDPNLVLAERRLVIVSGKSKSNQDIILVFDGKRRRGEENLNLLSTITTKMPVLAMDYDGRRLIALSQDGKKSQVSFISLSSKQSPQLEKNIDLEGSYNLVSRYKNVLVIAGLDKNGKSEARSIYLKPEPNVVAGTTLTQLDRITSALAMKDEVLVAGSFKGGRKLLSISMDRHANLIRANEIPISSAKKGSGASKLVFDGKHIYVGAGWSGVETLKKQKGDWSPMFLYSIPRMGASNMASWGNSAILVGGELIKYDLTDPASPKVDSKAPLTTPIKSMVGAGSFILCLTKDKLLLRDMDKIDKNVYEVEVKGNSLAFDKEDHKAYVVKKLGKVTRIFPYKVYSNSLDGMESADVDGNFTRIKAKGGYLLLSDLNRLKLVKFGKEIKTVGSRKFDNYAIRDASLVGDYVVATAIDPSSKGFLLVLKANDEKLNVLGNSPLPHNGAALACLKDSVATIGRNEKGEDLITLVDIKNPTNPQQIKSLRAIEAASSVAMKDKVALVAGRGLEILLVQ